MVGIGIGVLVVSTAALAPVSAGAKSNAATTWTSQLVDSAFAADDYSYTFTGIGIGPLGRAIIMYANGPNKAGGFDLRLARGPLFNGAFEIGSIDPAEPRLAGEESLVVGPKGRAYVSFTKGVLFDQGTLKYGVRIHGTWTIETADSVKSVGITELALGAHHQPYIAYSKIIPLNPGYSRELWIATKDQGVWTTSKVTDGDVSALDLALNAQGQPEIAFTVDSGVGVQNIVARIARFDGTSWSFQDIGHVVNGGIEFGIDLKIDAQGHEDVVYPVYDPVAGMMYGHYDGSQWNTQLIAEGNLWQPSMAYGPYGGIHVSYYNAEPGSLDYATLNGGTWDAQTLFDSPSPHVRIGRQSSLTFSPDGRAHVAYYVGKEFKGTFLRYAASDATGKFLSATGPAAVCAGPCSWSTASTR